MNRLEIENFAFIEKAHIRFGDLTVFVGPQATGKTLVLELAKLTVDRVSVMEKFRRYGFQWENEREFLSLYFGEGMEGIWREKETVVKRDGREIPYPSLKSRKGKAGRFEKVFYIPAQRVLIFENGWPKPFTSYSPGDPYVVRNFSEEMRILADRLGTKVFPVTGRMPEKLRDLLNSSILRGAELRRSVKEMRRKFLLKVSGAELPFMVWSAGQREFIPLLLGLYWLMPSGAKSKREDVDTVVIEEPEMGLHPRAVESVLVVMLELLRRGYRLIISTHSPQVLELVWVVNEIKERIGRKGMAPERAVHYLCELFGAPPSSLREVWKSAVLKDYRIFYFRPDGDSVSVEDISRLDLSDERGWGELTSFASRASEVMAKVVSENELQE